MIYAALLFIMLTGPDHQVIFLNPRTVVSMRTVREGEHVAKGVECLIHTTDGRFVGVIDKCHTVRTRMEKEAQK